MLGQLRLTSLPLAALFVLLSAPLAWAQTFDSGSDGLDGALEPTEDVVVQVPPEGVLRYTTVDIPSGVTVSFLPNAENTRVVLLVQGDMVVDGTIDVSGGAPMAATPYPGILQVGGAGGPGGYEGGWRASSLMSDTSTDGAGPGGGEGRHSGGQNDPGGGASPVTDGQDSVVNVGGDAWGDVSWLLLGGGSGGGGQLGGGGGGGGGGALTVAVSGTLDVTGQILARGADAAGGGGGGVIHLLATTIQVTATAQIDASGGAATATWGGDGGGGLVRIDAFFRAGPLATTCVPLPRISSLPVPPVPWADGERPRLEVISVDGHEPIGDLGEFPPNVAARLGTSIEVIVMAQYVPLGTPVTLRVQRFGGPALIYVSMLDAGDLFSSTGSFTINIPAFSRISTLQAYVLDTPIP